MYIYIYICCCLLSFLLLDPPPPPPPLSLPSLDTSLARPLSPFVCRPSEASTCMHACILLHIHSLVTFFAAADENHTLVLLYHHVKKKFPHLMGGLNLFSPQFFSFLVRNYFSLASQRRERYEVLHSLFLLLSSYSLSQLLRALHACILNRERELYYIIYSTATQKREYLDTS